MGCEIAVCYFITATALSHRVTATNSYFTLRLSVTATYDECKARNISSAESPRPFYSCDRVARFCDSTILEYYTVTVTPFSILLGINYVVKFPISALGPEESIAFCFTY